MSRSRLLTRRQFLRVSGSVAAASLLSACAAPTPTAEPEPTAATQATSAPEPTAAAPEPTAAPTAKYNEAPQLAELVSAGKLPPVEERLPKNPLVVQPVERIGKYGGTWNSGLFGGQDTAWLIRTIGYENLLRWDLQYSKIIPNLAESFEINEDSTEFTFKLREGVKWSDGEPFTADDIVFWYEDYALNEELSAGAPDWMVVDGQPGTVEKVDDYTVRFKFSKPNGVILMRLAAVGGDQPTRYPRHYLEEFHKKYNPNVEELVKEAEANSWVHLFQLKGSSVPGTPHDAVWYNKDLPRLHGWLLTTAYGEGTQVVAERNPYYWKVDPEGNQLPYIDKCVYDIAQDKEVLALRGMNGEIDMMDRHIGTMANKAAFVDNMEKGQYHFFETVLAYANAMLIHLNMTHKDPELRKVFQNKDFRIGLSHAINRQEIIDLVYVGQGEPWQCAPKADSPFYSEQMAKQYTEYSEAKANEYLDKAGYAERDAEGFRLRPDGKRITFTIDTIAGDRADAMALIEGYWKNVGIDGRYNVVDRSLLYTRKGANDHDGITADGASSTGFQAILAPHDYFAYNTESSFGEAWASWYNPAGSSGHNPQTAPEEPPEELKKQQELYDQIKSNADQDKQIELFKQILKIAEEQFLVLGITLVPNRYGIVKNNFHNVPESMPSAYQYPTPAPTNPCQYFIE